MNATSKAGDGNGELVLVALGGLGEIGMNAYLYGVGPPKARKWLMIDLGLTFPHDNEPGVDVVLPDLRFVEGLKDDLVGLLITHAHEDHYGAVLDLWPRLKCPIYATPFTAGMLAAKAAENGNRVKPPVTVVKMGGRFDVGPFDLELVTMSHSIPEPSGVVIRTALGTVFHSGDWKLDQTPLVGDPADENRLQQLGAEGVDVVVCDSTNAMRAGRSPSETDVARSLAEIVKSAKRRVAVTMFASNVARVKAVADAAEEAGRKLIVSGRALHRVVQVAKDTGYLPMNLTALDQQHFRYLEPHEVLAICTGSQGEGRAAMARIAEDEHPEISLTKGDMVIFSSRPIPGNEVEIGHVQNNLARLGCDVITDSDALVHVTGHPRRDELKQLYAWLKPKVVVPMHGEDRHMHAHAQLAKECGVEKTQICHNGEIVRLLPAPTSIIGDAPVGRLYRDGKLIIPSSSEGPVRQRRRLAFAGVACVAIALDKNGEIAADPEIQIDGIPAATLDGSSMEDMIYDTVEGTLESIPRKRRRDDKLVADAVRRAVRSAIDQAWGKKTIVKVLVCLV